MEETLRQRSHSALCARKNAIPGKLLEIAVGKFPTIYIKVFTKNPYLFRLLKNIFFYHFQGFFPVAHFGRRLENEFKCELVTGQQLHDPGG